MPPMVKASEGDIAQTRTYSLDNAVLCLLSPSEGSGQNHRLPPDNRKMPKKESKDMAERARENGGEK